jgi:hypothetical protein
MNETFQYDVFISHSAKDKPVVRERAEQLFDGFGPRRRAGESSPRWSVSGTGGNGCINQTSPQRGR